MACRCVRQPPGVGLLGLVQPTRAYPLRLPHVEARVSRGVVLLQEGSVSSQQWCPSIAADAQPPTPALLPLDVCLICICRLLLLLPLCVPPSLHLSRPPLLHRPGCLPLRLCWR